jgi:hypothetical protein
MSESFEIKLSFFLRNKHRGFDWISLIASPEIAYYTEIYIESINSVFLWYLTWWFLDFYYHNLSPRAHAEILWIVLFKCLVLWNITLETPFLIHIIFEYPSSAIFKVHFVIVMSSHPKCNWLFLDSGVDIVLIFKNYWMYREINCWIRGGVLILFVFYLFKI